MEDAPRGAQGHRRFAGRQSDRPRAMVEPARVFPANGAAADRRPRLDGVIGWSRMRAVRDQSTIGRFPASGATAL